MMKENFYDPTKPVPAFLPTPATPPRAQTASIHYNSSYYFNDHQHEIHLDTVPESPTQHVIIHPVRAFPTKNDTLTKAFFSISVPKHKEQLDKATRWLDPLRIDPTFGMGNDDSEEGRIRRTFRRLESSTLFSPPTKNSTSLRELVTDMNDVSKDTISSLSPTKLTKIPRTQYIPHGFGHGNRDGFEFSESYLSSSSFGDDGSSTIMTTNTGMHSHLHPSPSLGMKLVLVEEDKLREYSKFETILREERALLGEQCTMVLGNVQAHANIPLPATRLALTSLCETEMRGSAAKITKLSKQWYVFSKQNQYNRPHLYAEKDPSFLHHGPLYQRPIKLKMAREAVIKWEINKERDTMSYEDDMSRLVGHYLDAQIRKKDYDRYYILATRYGRYSPEEFALDSRPGRRYWMKAWRGAMMFQRAWDRFWSIAKLRRHRAARRVQTVWRRYWALKKIRPIYRIRKHFSRYASFLMGFRKWRDYQFMCRRVKHLVELWIHTWVPICFVEWKKLSMTKRERILAMREKAEFRSRNGRLIVRFARWMKFTKHSRRQKGMLRRILEIPQFGDWITYTKAEKHRKQLEKLNLACYAYARRWCIVIERRKRHEASRNIIHFMRLLAAMKSFTKRKIAAILREFVVYQPKELSRRAMKANEREGIRLQREEVAIKERERKERQVLKKFLLEEGGRLQIKEMVAARGGTPVKTTVTAALTNFSKAVYSYFRPRGTKSKGSKTSATVAVTNTPLGVVAATPLTIGNGAPPEKSPEEMAEELAIACRKELVDRCNALSRQLERHDFRAIQTPFTTCPSPLCYALCASEEQYRRHVLTCDEKAHPGCGFMAVSHHHNHRRHRHRHRMQMDNKQVENISGMKSPTHTKHTTTHKQALRPTNSAAGGGALSTPAATPVKTQPVGQGTHQSLGQSLEEGGISNDTVGGGGGGGGGGGSLMAAPGSVSDEGPAPATTIATSNGAISGGEKGEGEEARSGPSEGVTAPPPQPDQQPQQPLSTMSLSTQPPPAMVPPISTTDEPVVELPQQQQQQQQQQQSPPLEEDQDKEQQLPQRSEGGDIEDIDDDIDNLDHSDDPEDQRRRNQFAAFHIMLKSSRGCQIFRDHLVDKHGIDLLVHTLDLWSAIQDWKKSQSSVGNGEEYHRKAFAIYDMYLRADATRSVRLTDKTTITTSAGTMGPGTSAIADALTTLLQVKNREYVGFFRGEKIRGGVLRNLIGLPAKVKEKWTDEQILPATIFQDLNWHCVVTLFQAYVDTFLRSTEHDVYTTYAAEENSKRDEVMLEEFRRLRHARYIMLAKDTKRDDELRMRELVRINVESDILCIKAVDQMFIQEIHHLYDSILHDELREEVFQIVCQQQAIKEGTMMVGEEVVEWGVEKILEETYEFYVTALINTMWNKPECQDGMMIYAGLKKSVVKDMRMQKITDISAANMAADLKKAQQAQEWLSKLVVSASEDEKKELMQAMNASDPSSIAATVIQRRARGITGRKLARKAFATTFTKKYDPPSQLYFYLNNSYNVTAWQRPLIMRHLFPTSMW